MVVTAAVFQLERSALNAQALSNAERGNRKTTKISNGDVRVRVNRIQVNKEAKKEKQKKSGGVDVLCIMFVTAVVFQFERSALNA